MATTTNEFSKAFLEAINTVGEANANAKEATLVVETEIDSVLDEGLGQYQVKYLGNKFEATSANKDVAYEIGDIVYTIIPNGNFDKPKVILSPANPSETVYADAVDGTSFITLGDNLFARVGDIALCTQRPHTASIVTDIDTTGFNALFQSSLKDSRTFNFSCTIQTNIQKEHRSKGNYGLILDIPIAQKVDGVIEKRYYSITLDINNIQGDAYDFRSPALQNLYFELPADYGYDDTKVPRIRSFVEGFTVTDPTAADDIFIRNVKVLPTLAVAEGEMTGYYSVITASGGSSFLASRTEDVKVMSVTAYLNGKVTKVTNFESYWFRENATIDATSDGFQKYGGLGWEILNPKNPKYSADGGAENSEYLNNVYTQTVSQNDIHCDTKFKNVLVKGEKVITSTITIKNLANDATLSLRSTSGSNSYPVGVGTVELELDFYESGITDVTYPDFTVGYGWQRFDKKGGYLDNDFYTVVEQNYRKNGHYYTIIRYPVKEIDEANTISCTVFLKGKGGSTKIVNIGTVWIGINTNEQSGSRVVLTNGDKLYKYDADGDSPLSADYDGPVSSKLTALDPIEARLFTAEGTEFTDDMYSVTYLTWMVPVNSMYVLTSIQKAVKSDDGQYYLITGSYKSNKTLKYDISNTYNKLKQDNTILVRASAVADSVINGEIPEGVANIRFLKDGESGTNGSKYSAILTYNGYGYGEKNSAGLPVKFQMVYAGGAWYIFNPASPKSYSRFSSFKLGVDLYRDGEKVTGTPSVSWKIFDAGQSYTNQTSPVDINATTGYISLSGANWTDTSKSFCATIEAKIFATRREGSTALDTSITDSEEYVYAYYPIECTYLQSTSLLGANIPTLEGGYYKVLFAADGTNPQYDNSQAFYPVNTIYNDDEGDLFDYYWSASNNLKVGSTKIEKKCKVTPVSKYDNGEARNFVRVELSRSASENARLTNDINTALAGRNTQQNRYDYYTLLQNNLDIFGNFDYNRYVTKLTYAADFYAVKTNLVKLSDSLYNKVTSMISTCNRYRLKDDGGIDSWVVGVTSALQDKLSTLKNLKDLSSKLGTSSNIIEKILAITPNNLTISLSNLTGRTCYTTISDAVSAYNNIIRTSYTEYHSALGASDMNGYDTLVQSIMTEIRNIAFSTKLSNLSSAHYGVDERVSEFSGIQKAMQTYVNSAGDEADTYSFNLVIEKVIKPIYDSIKYYITFYQNGGYSSLLSNIQAEINQYNTNYNNASALYVPQYTIVKLIHVKPIIMLYNRYEMSNINGWDGNKLDLNGDAGYILAPQMGAGKKDSGNRFTGVIMGVKQLQKNSTNNQRIGLFGYSEGIQSFFLNAENGSALFGKSGSGQIAIDPTQNKGLLYSNLFWKNFDSKTGLPSNYTTGNYNKQGMLIDLSTPEIRFGNGNFSVDENGSLTAAGGGNIAGWKISDTQIYSNVTPTNGRITLDSGATVTGADAKGNKTYSYTAGKIFSHSHDTLAATSKGFYLSQDGLSISDSGSSNRIELSTTGNPKIYSGGHSTLDSTKKGFYLSQDGLSISNGTTSRIAIDTSGQPTIYSGGHNTLDNTSNGFYLGNDGLSIGSKVKITKDGVAYFGNGAVNGSSNKHWTINGSSESYIAYNTTSFNSDSNSVYLGTDGISLGTDKFWVKRSGEMMSKFGHIGGWEITSTTLKAGNIELNSNGSMKGGSGDSEWSITQSGVATFKTIYASNKGTIGGWTINPKSLSADGITISAEGAIHVGGSGSNTTGWSISKDGSAHFKNITATNTWSFGSGKNTWSNTGNFNFGLGSLGGNTVNGNLAFTNGSMNMGTAKQGSVGVSISKDSVTIAGDIYANNGYFSGEIEATKFSFADKSGHYLKMGYSTSHPEASGFNITGEGGIALNGHGISNVGNISGVGTISGSPQLLDALDVNKQALNNVGSINNHYLSAFAKSGEISVSLDVETNVLTGKGTAKGKINIPGFS